MNRYTAPLVEVFHIIGSDIHWYLENFLNGSFFSFFGILTLVFFLKVWVVLTLAIYYAKKEIDYRTHKPKIE